VTDVEQTEAIHQRLGQQELLPEMHLVGAALRHGLA
jgi:hypothetical protein